MRLSLSKRACTQGFSLVELMVALTIGSIMIVGAVYVYSQSRTSYMVNDSSARMQEEARYAFSIIEPDVQLAGYYGFTNTSDDVWLVSVVPRISANDVRQGDPAAGGLAASINDCGNNFALDLMTTVQGSDDRFLPAAGAGCATAVPSLTADTLTIRRASTNQVLQQANRLQLFTDRLNKSNHELFVSGIPSAPVVDGLREVHDLIVRTYYVAQDSDGRPGFPSLRVISLGAGQAYTDLELIPGVEDIQVQFGIDTGDYNKDGVIDDDKGDDGIPEANGIVTRYLDSEDPIIAALNPQIVTVRIWLRLRADQPEAGFQDTRTYTYADVVNWTPPAAQRGFRRLLISRTIFLRNARTL